jgi:hypothetical protein
MPSIGQENLETVMIDFFGGLRRGDLEAAAGLLDPDVSWQGLREEWVCNGREEVIDTFRWGSSSAARSTHWSSPAAASGSCWARADRASARRKCPWTRSSTSLRCATDGSCASTTTGAAGRRSRQPASPRTRTGADPAGLSEPGSCRAGRADQNGRAVPGRYSGGSSSTVPAPPFGRGRRGSRTPMSGSAGGSSSQALGPVCSHRRRRTASSRLKRLGCRQRGLSIAPIVAVDRCVRACFSCARGAG